MINEACEKGFFFLKKPLMIKEKSL